MKKTVIGNRIKIKENVFMASLFSIFKSNIYFNKNTK